MRGKRELQTASTKRNEQIVRYSKYAISYLGTLLIIGSAAVKLVDTVNELNTLKRRFEDGKDE